MTITAMIILGLAVTLGDGGAGCPPEGAGDDCADAIAVGDGVYAGDLADNAADAIVDCGFENTISAWYCYAASCTGTLTVTTCLPGTMFDSVLSAFDGCGGAELACNDDAVGAPAACDLGGLNRKSSISLPVTSGQTLVVRVSVWNDDFLGQGGTGSTYEIEFTCTAPMSTCADITGPETGVPDGNVDALDFLYLLSQWSSPCTGNCSADFTGPDDVPDGNIDAWDVLQMIEQWGSPANCPP